MINVAKKKNLGKKLGRELRSLALGAATGSGKYAIARGRGAYGRGEYTMGATSSSPSVNSLFVDFDKRRMKTSHVGDETGRITVSRREYVMKVSSPTVPSDFSNTSLSINPGQTAVFAWASQIAQNYDEYELRHLVFHYKPVISQASQTGAMGSVLMSCNYNAGAEKFESFREMVEYMGSMETRICDEAYFGVECDSTKNGSQAVEYVRAGSVPVGEDIKTYDLGKFQIATSDISATDYPAGTLLGHLYVEYDLVLGKPKLYAALGKSIKMDMWRGLSPTVILPFSAAPIANQGNSLGLIPSTTDNVCRIPDEFYGRLMVTYYLIDTASTGVSGVPILTGNVVGVPLLGVGTAFSQGTDSNYTSDVCVQFLIDVKSRLGTGPNNTFSIVTSLLTAPTTFNMVATQVNPDFDSW